jgi:adenylate cyclase
VSRRRSPLFAVVLVALVVTAGVVGVRSIGLLEAIELATYDAFIRMRPGDPPPDPRITIVTVTEADIPAAGGWPLSDAVVAQAIETIGQHRPRAIGLDIYRDVPVPPGTEALDRVLRGDPRVIVVTKFGEGPSLGVRAPKVLQGTEQVGFNDILVDPGGVVRRALLFLDDGQTSVAAFGLRAALLYLAPEGVTPQPAPDDPTLLRLGRTTIRPLESHDGGYVGTDARGYQIMLDFAGGRRSFTSVRLSDLFEGSFAPAVLRDRIVLIGVAAESIKDDFFTPYSRGLGGNRQFMPGVTVHAHVASQLLRMSLGGQASMASIAEWHEWVWITAWSAAGALVGFAVRSPWRFSLAAAGGFAALAGFDLTMFLRGWWIPLIPAALAWFASSGLVTAYMSHQERLQRAQLMQLFSRHVSKEVASSIWEQRDQFVDGGRPRSERMIVTALFTDLTGFTAVAESHAPEMLMDWLNEYMDAMAREVSRHGGVIRQYAGDAIVAVFGIPVPRRDAVEIARDARLAVECALAMEEALAALNRRWRTEGRPRSGMRVGIFTGPVVAGTLGSADRSEYVTVGDTMNTAYRLESYDKEFFAPDADARPCRTLIGETTLIHLGEQFETAPVGEIRLKGKEHTVGVFRLIGRRHVTPAGAGEMRDESHGSTAPDRPANGRVGASGDGAGAGKAEDAGIRHSGPAADYRSRL